MALLIDSISHFLVDGVCAATVFGRVTGEELAILIMLYNTLAFSTQCLVGLVTDRAGRLRLLTAGGSILVVLGFALPLPGVFRVILIGIGNSIFHVGGGTRTLLGSEGKAGPLGVFVAPGSMGLVLGTLFPSWGVVFAVLLGLCAAATLLLKNVPDSVLPGKSEKDGGLMLPVVLLTMAVAVRAAGGSCVSFPWKTGAALTIIMTLFVFGGKTLGGFVCDRLGTVKTALVSMPLAGLLIAFCSAWMLPSLAGQLLVNLTMPLTLYLMYRAIPDSPGFAFGLAASALWPGTIAGNLIQLTGLWQSALIILCFVLGLISILYSKRRIER